MSRMAAAGVVTARSVSVSFLALSLLAVAPAASGLGGPAAAAPTASAAAVPATTPAMPLAPADLAALEAKMAQLQVTSERYSTRFSGSFRNETVQVTGNGTCPAKGKCHSSQKRHVTYGRPHRVHEARTFEADVVAGVGEGFDASGRPRVIIIGRNFYVYAPQRRGRGRARPWLHQILKGTHGVSPLAFVLPFSGGGSSETNLGGSGPFTRLVNLLRTATGAVTASGPLTVDGQQTTELAATVTPAELVAGLPPKQLTMFRKLLPQQQLQIFVNASGLPLRVVTVTRTASSSVSETIDLLAVNTPVTVKAPPAGRTRSPHGAGGAIGGLISIET